MSRKLRLDVLATKLGLDRLDRKRRIMVFSAAGALVLLFLLFVWPTPYSHPRDSDRYRVSRFTGKAEVYDRRREEWRPARRGRNASGTRDGGSPIGGGRSGRSGSAEGENWWYEGSGSGGKKRKSAQGDQWWYQEDGGSRRGSGESPIGGSRSGGSRSPIGGSRTSDDGGGGGDGSPIGGSDRPRAMKEKPREEAAESARDEAEDKEDPFWRD